MFEDGAILKQRYGEENVFDLSLGNPVMEPPAEFFQELRQIAEQPRTGMHRYMSNAGYAETRTAVAEELSRETGIKFTLNEIIMTCGAAGALNVVLKAILNHGDEIIIFAPYFAEYVHYIDNHYGVARILPTDAQFAPQMEALEKTINERTRAVLVNSPNNPSGAVYSVERLNDMGDILRRKEEQFGISILLISDEAYRRLIFDGQEYPFPLLHHPNSIITTSHSKDLALPGERIGYIAVHPGFIHLNRTLGFVNASALMQHIVRRLQAVTVSVAEYQQKRDFLYQNLSDMGYSLAKPQGAFYMFPRSPLEDDLAFVRELLELKVLTVPGRGFGTPGYFRIAYCVEDKVLQGSLAGFREAAHKFGLC
jgi:aspartate aminotransferase